VNGELDSRPWRRAARAHFPGVPAWGAPAAEAREPFDISPLEEVTPEWAWGGCDGSGARVCILDSGVDSTHPLVDGLDRSMAVAEMPGGELDVVDTDPIDAAGHGTACASVIRSVAPGVSLTSVRVLTDGQFGTGAALLAGLKWAIADGFDVINMSLSTAKEQFCLALHELADIAYFRRCAIVASAHNMPIKSYPWAFSSVISVASHDESDPMVYYYNPAPPVEFLAKGVGVKVAWLGGGQIQSTGNSFAAPHIAGICSRILGKHPMLTPFQLKSVLYLAASNTTDKCRRSLSDE
jgi:subtilisin